MSRRSRRVAGASIAVALAFTVAACADSPSDEGSSSDTTEATVTTAVPADGTASTEGPEECAEADPLPKGVIDGKPTTVDLPADPTTGEVVVTTLEDGDGPEVTDASYVTVQYVGVSCASGQQFDSSWDRGDPITIAMPDAPPTATAFSVIPGWNQGLLGVPQGSLVQLDIPSDLAYGPQGQPPDIAPNDPLTFVIRVDEVSDEAPAA